jgi:hypothetical protein
LFATPNSTNDARGLIRFQYDAIFLKMSHQHHWPWAELSKCVRRNYGKYARQQQKYGDLPHDRNRVSYTLTPVMEAQSPTGKTTITNDFYGNPKLDWVNN